MFQRTYNRDRSSCMVHNGCVFRDHRVVVTSQLRSQLLNELHHMHTGVERIRRLAREVIVGGQILIGT